MAGRLHQVLTFLAVAPGGQATLAHDIRWNARPVIPDWILGSVDNGAFTIISCTDTDLTVQNDDAAPANLTFWLTSHHSILRQFNDVSTQFLAPLPFVIGGGGGGGGSSGSPQIFRYTVTGLEADLSDFFILLPAARANDVYRVVGSLAGAAAIVGMDFPDLVVGDRTTTQFRVIASSFFTAGDQIDLYVSDPV